MNNKNNTILVGIAGSIAIIFFELALRMLSIVITGFDWNIVILILGTFSVYLLSFKFIDFLDNKFLWRLYHPVLNGTWELQLDNLEDGSKRIGKTVIRQTRDTILITAINYKLPKEDEPYSTWKSVEAIIGTSELFFTYEVESSIDIKPFKRGYMKFTIISKKPKELLGNYYDAAPSNCQGPIVLKRI